MLTARTLMTARTLNPAVVSVAVTALVASAAWGQEPDRGNGADKEAAKPFRVRERFQGPLALMTKEHKAASLNVAVQAWSIDASLGRQTIHLAEFTLFQVRGGQIRMFLDGKEEIKRPDTFWTLPAGAIFTFEVKGETALLEATTVAMR